MKFTVRFYLVLILLIAFNSSFGQGSKEVDDYKYYIKDFGGDIGIISSVSKRNFDIRRNGEQFFENAVLTNLGMEFNIYPNWEKGVYLGGSVSSSLPSKRSVGKHVYNMKNFQASYKLGYRKLFWRRFAIMSFVDVGYERFSLANWHSSERLVSGNLLLGSGLDLNVEFFECFFITAQVGYNFDVISPRWKQGGSQSSAEWTYDSARNDSFYLGLSTGLSIGL